MRRSRLVLLAIVVLAFALRITGIGYGLPQRFIGDEFLQVAVALKMFDEKALVPNFPKIFYHQPLSAYISTIGIGAYLAAQLAAGKFESVSAMRDFYAVHSADLLIVPRFLSALLGALTVLVLYFIGRDLSGKRAGIITALLGAVDFTLVYTNHSGRVWGYMTFFVALAFWASVKLFQKDTLKNYLWAAGAAFLAAANLLPGLITFVPTLVSRFAWKNRKLWLSIALLALGSLLILAASPRGLGALLLRFDINVPFLSQTVFNAPANPFSHAAEESFFERFTDPFVGLINYTPILFVLFLAGAVFLVREDRRKFWFLISFPVAYYLFIGPLFSYGWVARTLIPFPIYFAPVAAYAILKISEKMFVGSRRSFAVLGVAALVPGLLLSVWFNAKIVRADTRTQAIEWIYEHLPEHARIMVFSLTNDTVNQDRAILELMRDTVPDELNTRQRTLLASGDSAYPRPEYFAWDLRDIPPSSLPEQFFKDNGFTYYMRTDFGINDEQYFDDLIEGQFAEQELLKKFTPFKGVAFTNEDILSSHNMVSPLRALVKAERFGPVVEIFRVRFR